ncbi:MAG: arginine--tRNA ligase [Limnochordales bacterium]|nr:arginine--tRNA ligase [Limnochordales bacterium]
MRHSRRGSTPPFGRCCRKAQVAGLELATPPSPELGGLRCPVSPWHGYCAIPTRFGIHHLRTTRIGQALSRIFEALGYEVIKICYWVTGVRNSVRSSPLTNAGAIQVGFSNIPCANCLTSTSGFTGGAGGFRAGGGRGRAWFRRLEMGDPEATALWQQFRDWSVRDLKRVYSRMRTTCQVIRNGLRLLGLAAPEEM